MAANTHLIGDKETNNWFKVCIGLNVTKEGLTNFLCAELHKVHTVVGRSCENCPIENLIQCPTNPYCNNRKRNYCPFHKLQKPQPCPICDNVKDNIILHHRYGKPSWRNTRAEKWALNDWEIGKCYLPPDGYSSISSVQESDFNGVISIMLNCLHFQTCLSPLCLSPPPPDKQCPLEKVRQIGRDVRHTSDCKVTDADLQDYFKTLSTLLADPQYLQHDPSAIIACTRLSDLQNDRMSFEELGKLLKEVNQTLEEAKKTGKRFSEIAEKTLSTHLQKLNATYQLGLIRLKMKTTVGEQRLDSKTKFGVHRLERKTQFGAQRIESSVQHGIERMQQAANKTAQADYEREVADFRRRLVEHYNDTSSNVPLSVLDQSLDKRITDIYATPKMHRFDIASDGKRVKKDIVLTYKELFYTDDTKSNRRVYVQGEPGSGKSTFAAKLVHDWCDENRPSTAAPNKNASFDDVLIIQNFQFIFFLSLGESRGQTEVTHMIKQQIIDKMYSDEKRDVMYTLLLRIIETEICLVIRDGLDEWVAPDGSNLAEPSMAGFPKDKCAVLTTSRPWKLADERIKNSRIDILVEIEGISDSATFSERVLRCILDKSKDLETTAWEIRCFIVERGLESLSNSPMLYTLVICTWVDTMEEEEHLNGSSLCSLYTTFLESLCKKANDTTGFFNDLNPPHVKCFSRTSYLRPIIQNVDVISKAAFHLLFSPEKEKSIVFNDQELSNYLTPSEQEFALKAGLISKRKTKRALNSSISFIHKSMQEFLAAYHIAHNAHLIDDVISGYLGRHSDAYRDISQVFIFLCGLKISAANKLSCIMNEHHNINMIHWSSFLYKCDSFQSIIEAGYTEAVSNDQTGILLRLSHFYSDGDNLMVMNNIWRENKSNALALEIHVDDETDHASSDSSDSSDSSSTHSEPTSQIEFDLSSCLNLKDLILSGSGIHLQDSSSSVSSTLPVCIVLNSANPAKCADPPPLLPCIEWILLEDITCSSTWLRSLFSTLLTLEQNAVCELSKVSCQGTFILSATLSCLKKTLKYESDPYLQECDVLWEVLHGLNIKSLSLDTSVINCADMMSQSLSTLTHLDTLSIKVDDDSPGLWGALHGLNIKSLSLSGSEYRGLNVNYADSMAQSLSSLTHLDTLSIKVGFDDSGLWQALRGLNIISLSLSGLYGGFSVDYADSMSQSLSSLTHLDTLSIEVGDDSPGLWEALHGLNIKSLSLRGRYGKLNVNYADSMSQSLLSLTHLDTLSIEVDVDSPGLWKALHGLNIKSLSLSGSVYTGLNVNYADSMSQSLLSLTHLDTLSIEVDVDSPGLWKAPHGLNIKSLSLSLNAWRGYLKEHNADSMSQSLLSLTHLDTLSIEVNDDSPGLWQALRGLNIISLSLSGLFGGFSVDYADSMSQSLSSLTHLDTLSIEVEYDSPGLWEALHGLNIKSLSLRGPYGKLNVNYADSMSQSLSSLTHLDTLSIKVGFDDSGLWQALRGLNIISLSLSGLYGGFSVDYADSMSQSLSSLTHLDTLSIEVEDDSPGLWEALHGLNIKSLSLRGRYGKLNVSYADSMSQSLLSLTHLDTLSIEVDVDSPGLWKALHGLNIKSLSLSGSVYRGLNVNYADSMSQSLLSLTHLDTLSIEVDVDSPGLWKALHGLNIKSLSLSGSMYRGLNVNYADSMSQSLSSLTHLDTLSIVVYDDSPGLWKALHGLNIKSLSLNAWRGYLKEHNADSMSQSLLSLTHLDTLSIEVNDDSPGLWEALRGLNIISLSLSGLYGGFSVDYADSMSQSLSSLTHLDTLSIEVEYDSPGLWEALHGLNIKSLSLRGPYGKSNVNYADSMSQSLSSLTHLDTLSIKVGFDDSGLWQALRGLNIISLSLSGLYGGFSVDYADSMSQSLSSLTHLDTLSIEVEDDSPGLWEALHGLNIKSLSLRGRYGKLNVNYVDSMSQSILSLTHLDTLSIEVDVDSPGLWKALHGLNIKSLSLSGSVYRGLNVNYADSMSQSLLSLTHLDTLSIEVDVDSPGLWKALHGLNIKSLSLSAGRGYLKEHNADSMSQSLLSLTHLDTLSIEVNDDSPGLWKALHGLNIKSLILSDRHGYLNVKHAETIAQSLSSLKQLEKLSIFLLTYIDIKLPQSLKYLNIYCVTLLPSELHELVGPLSACTRTVESKLEFGCASFNDARVKPIPPEEYISIQQELGTLNHVAVKRFRILHRRKNNFCEYDAASPWSVRGIGGVQDDNTDDDNVNDVAYKSFVTATADSISNGIINRIAMRLLITPSSNS